MAWTIYEDTSSDQVKGQLSLFNEPEKNDRIEKEYASPCGGCICNQCANEVNGRYKPGEMIEACFNCEECRYYDGNTDKRSNKKTECCSFRITEYHAAQRRMKIKLIR